jgi:hypothetical protein
MICYKVVGKENRYGSNYTMLYSDNNMPETGIDMRVFKRFFPKYEKGKIVKAIRGSQGIFCFQTKTDAQKFRHTCSENFQKITTIIKVEGIGEPNYFPKIIKECGAWLSNLLSYKTTQAMIEAPMGSISFKSVRVLE